MPVPRSIRALDAARRRARGGDIATMTLDEIHAARGPYIPDDAPGAAILQRLGRFIAGTPRDDVRVTEVTVPGAVGPLTARRHEPPDPAPNQPLVLHLHGGGWVVGGPIQYDWICGELAAGLGAVVVSVDFRKAPEHPAPAAPDDANAAARWLLGGGGADLGAPGPMVVAGDSAGGNLSALAAIAVRDAGLDGLVAQLLIYPGTDLTSSMPSVRELDDEPILKRPDIDGFLARYLAGDVAADDPRVSPLFVDDLAGLAPACVQTAEFDPLKDEGAAYAARLAEAGVPVRYTEYVDMPHGFVSLPGLAPSARQAVAELVQFARPLVAAA